MDVRPVDRTALEMDLGEAQVAAVLADDGLGVDLTDKDRVLGRLPPGFRDADHPHAPILAQTGAQ
jgi:hypothetical protein